VSQRAWISDIAGALGPTATIEYVVLWCCMQDVTLGTTSDMLSWRWSANGAYSAKSSYIVLFSGSTTVVFWKLIWRSWATLNVKFFLWLASQNR
jgi:hypothetical protein